MHKSTTKCNETLGKWCKNKHGASKIMDTLETYHSSPAIVMVTVAGEGHEVAAATVPSSAVGARLTDTTMGVVWNETGARLGAYVQVQLVGSALGESFRLQEAADVGLTVRYLGQVRRESY
jgi:hypothetical protein